MNYMRPVTPTDRDYTSIDLLNILSPKINRSSNIQSDISNFDYRSHHRLSLDQAMLPPNRYKRIGDNNYTQTPESKQNMDIRQLQQPQKTGHFLKRPVTSINQNYYERISFDSSRERKRGMGKELINILHSKQSSQNIDSFCYKTSESIIFNPNCTALQQSNNHQYLYTNAFQKQRKQKLEADQFKKIKFLGKGKLGQVYLVMHKSTGFVCAMKILDKEMIRSEKMENQIIREIRIHNNLQSVNIINFYGFFDDSQSVYILLQYATDGSMLSLLKQKNRLEEDEIVDLVRGVSYGVRYIHKMGYIHRDLKPQNIVMNFNIPKICDFGWATIYDDIQLCKSYCGTPLYLSPEMIKKQLYGQSVDIWTIGHLTYELLVGRVAFSIWSQNDFDLVLKSSVKIPEYIDRSQKCQDFIRKTLDKNVQSRLSIDDIVKHDFLAHSNQNNIDKEVYRNIKKIMDQ